MIDNYHENSLMNVILFLTEFIEINTKFYSRVQFCQALFLPWVDPQKRAIGEHQIKDLFEMDRTQRAWK